MNRKYVLLAIAALALVALWYFNRQGLLFEGFTQKNNEMGKKGVFEYFNDAQKELGCKTLKEQVALYTDMLKTPASTDEEKEMQKEITKTIENLNAELMNQSCPA